MRSAETEATRPWVRDIGMTRIEAATCSPVKEVTFKENFGASITQVSCTSALNVDDRPHRSGWDAKGSDGVIQCLLGQRLTWAGEIHVILRLISELAVRDRAQPASREIR